MNPTGSSRGTLPRNPRGTLPRNPTEKLIVALDIANPVENIRLANLLREHVRIFKIGLAAFAAAGEDLVSTIRGMERDVFLDLKLFDIPHQVAGVCREITKMAVKMFTIHLFGGIDMMKKAVETAREEAESLGLKSPLVVGVTVLTSLNESDLHEMGVSRGLREEVLYLSTQAKKAGLDGVVASPHEIEAIKEACGRDFLVIVPGVRVGGASSDDQKRVLTPREAIDRGADYIVVGRPITQAPEPLAAARNLLRDING